MGTHLDTREASRAEEQVRLDLLKSAAERNEWGQFATPPVLAAEMAEYTRKLWHGRSDKVRFLDPAVGTGSFFSALRKAGKPGWLASASGIELDSQFADAATRLWGSEGLRVVTGDFTKLQPPRGGERPNLILTNPPYVRHHHLEAEDKIRLKTIASGIAGTDVSGLTGLYCYFMFLSHHWLADGGMGVWLVPVGVHGRELREGAPALSGQPSDALCTCIVSIPRTSNSTTPSFRRPSWSTRSGNHCRITQ